MPGGPPRGAPRGRQRHRVGRRDGARSTTRAGSSGMTLEPGQEPLALRLRVREPHEPSRARSSSGPRAATHANEFAQAQYPGRHRCGPRQARSSGTGRSRTAADLTWWKNVAQCEQLLRLRRAATTGSGPTTTRFRRAGARRPNHRVMPGKKLWTWGSGPSGRIWEDILTEGGAPVLRAAGGRLQRQPARLPLDGAPRGAAERRTTGTRSATSAASRTRTPTSPCRPTCATARRSRPCTPPPASRD